MGISLGSEPLSSLLFRQKTIIYAGLLAIGLASWGYMLWMAWAMEHMDVIEMWMPPRGGARPWEFYDFWMCFVMWIIMMIAMMLPSISPMVLLFSKVNKTKKEKEQIYAPTFIFLSGYLLSWAVFSIIATLVQWPLHESALLNPMMNSRSYLLSGLILTSAGIYQFTPLKEVCLKHCRTPLTYLFAHWKDGKLGALYMGLHHGTFCVGCCWMLMAILFALGVMNLLWIMALALFVLFEKIPYIKDSYIRTIPGFVFIGWGVYWVHTYFLVNHLY